MVEVAERQFVECAQCGNSIFKKQYELNKHAKDGFKNHFCCKGCSQKYQKGSKRQSVSKKLSEYYHKKRQAKLYHLDRYRNDPEYKTRKLQQAKDNRNPTTYRERRLAKKSKAIKLLGGKCSICDYDKCQASLDFHHIKGSEKKRINFASAWPKILKEIRQCVLLCANCHRELHFTENDND